MPTYIAKKRIHMIATCRVYMEVYRAITIEVNLLKLFIAH